MDDADSNELESTSLGDVFGNYAANPNEIKRIASMLQAKATSPPKYVFYKYAPKTELFKQAEKKEKIDGFRKGTDAYKEKLLQRLAEHIGNPKARNHDNCWALYRMSVYVFATNELKALERLLKNSICGESLSDHSAILKRICSNAFEFEVTPEDVRKLYDVWWAPPVDDLEEILKLCSHVDPVKIHTKQLSTLRERVDSLTKSIDKISKDFESDKSKNEKASSDSTYSVTQLDKRIAIVETISAESAKAISDYSKGTHARFDKIEQQLEKIESKATKLESSLNQDQTKKLIDHAIKTSSTEQAKSLTSSTAALRLEFTNLQTELATQMNEINQQLSILTNQVEDLQERAIQNSGGITYKSPLSRSVPTTAQSYKISKELDFVNSWAATLSKTHQISISLEEVVAYHCILLTNNIIIADYRLIDSWIDCLGWASYTRHIAASPLWSREEDWADGAHHLFNIQTGKRTPKLLIIHNFDVGITDCYLIPTLLLWCINRSDADHLTKLLLIPSGEQNSINPQILEHAATIDFANSTYQLEFSNSLPSIPAYKKEIPVGVDPKLVIQWADATTTLTYDLKDCIQKPFGLTLSYNLISKFQRTLSSANRFFKDSSAVGIGMHHHILPWIKLKDSSIYGAICSRVTQLLDIQP